MSTSGPLPDPAPRGAAIDRAAGPFVAASAVPAVLAAVAGRRRIALSLLALPAGVAAFFRDPDRTPDHRQVDRDLVLAPADGLVMHAGPGQDGVAPPGEWQQVSIFLSLFDVHINRTPYGGTVEDVTYRPGRWHAAYKFESATENERSEITLSDVVDGETRIVVFRQIVGLVARRVVTRVQKGDVLRAGQRIGLMKFGSRMDVFVPAHVPLDVAVGDKTVAGETVLARWPSPATSRQASPL
jgi:phosphatidylserine decarboxylase